MKKAYYLLAYVLVVFTACQKQPIIGGGANGSSYIKTINYTLSSADYAPLGSTVYSYKTKSFSSDADAKLYIPTILNSKFPQLDSGSTANISFYEQPILADSLYSDILYAPTTADYYSVTVKYSDFSTAQAIAFLNLKYPTPVANQLSVLNYTYYESGFTPSAGIPNTIHSYLYLNGSWAKIYTITAAQYASAFRGQYNEFVAADAPNLANIFNTFLKADPQVAATAKAGNVIYVSYNYYASKDYQRVLALGYDGTNWTTATTSTLAFIKKGSTWIPDPTVYYTVNANGKDNTLIANSTFANATARSNYGSYGDFNIQSSSPYYWSQTDINNAMILVLTTDFPNPKVNTPYKITYLAYNGSTYPVTSLFNFDGTNWSFVQ